MRGNAGRVGKLLRLVRRERGLTQADLAGRLGIHVNTLSKWERGISEPPLSMLGLISDSLGVEPNLFADLKLRGWQQWLR